MSFTAVLDEHELEAWGAAIGRSVVERPAFVALDGPLGAGKSTLVRAACRAAGVRGPVQSPTYTLVQRHAGDAVIWHADLYRIAGPEDLAELGWGELGAAEETVFVEWAERAAGALPSDRWHIRLGVVEGGARRSVEVHRVGDSPEVPPPARDPT